MPSHIHFLFCWQMIPCHRVFAKVCREVEKPPGQRQEGDPSPPAARALAWRQSTP